jgi:nucleoid-associated protein YgaU
VLTVADVIGIPSGSRYKDTPVYDSADGPVFALMEPPEEFVRPQSSFQFHRVKRSEIGFLDLLASRYYGQGQEDLWWAIALANAMVDPEKDMYVGQVLVIPDRTTVLDFVSRIRRV